MRENRVDRPDETDDGGGVRPSGPAIALSTSGVGKSYTGTTVLSDINISIRAGEILALCGENGAGKSTLVNILGGVIPPDTGSVLVADRPVPLGGPTQANQLGIAVIHQHPVLFPDLSIAENIALVDEHGRGRYWMRHKRARTAAAATLSELGMDLNPARNTSTLAIADQQMVEIAKALIQSPRVLILDEPTASLTPHEVDRLFLILRGLRDRGVALMIVNHRMPEVFALSDRICVLRSGQQVGTSVTADVSSAEVVQQMVGREVKMGQVKGTVKGDVVLKTIGLTRRGVFRDVSLAVRSGEIVGLAGLIGAGRTDIARAIFGLDRVDAGEVEVGGRRIRSTSPGRAMTAGLAFVPEDRHGQGLAMDGTITENAAITSLPEVSTRGWVSPRRERAFAEDLIERMRVVCRGPEQSVSALSGGNQQKVVLGRWLATGPRVLLLDEPTFGVDVGAQQEIHELIRSLAGSGVAVLLISSDLLELLALSDRVMVVREGEIVADVTGTEMTEVSIMAAAVGSNVT